MCNVVDAGDKMIRNAILAALDNNIVPKIQPAVKSIYALPRQDFANLVANSEREERAGATYLFCLLLSLLPNWFDKQPYFGKENP